MKVAAAGRGVCVANGDAKNRKSHGGARKTSGVSESLLREERAQRMERELGELMVPALRRPCAPRRLHLHVT
jgi:hypothetical protein